MAGCPFLTRLTAIGILQIVVPAQAHGKGVIPFQIVFGGNIHMKKVIAILLVLMMLLAVSACETDDEKKDSGKKDDKKNEATKAPVDEDITPDSSTTPSTVPVVQNASQGLDIKDYYEDEDKYVPAGSAMLSGIGTCTDSNLVIPSVAPNGKPVAVIEDYSFEDCGQIESVVIPASVTKIMNNAFSSCENLHSVTLPNSLKMLGSSSFSGCHSLESIVIPEGVEILRSSMFNSCTSLKSVTLPNSLKEIYHDAFNHCTSLESIVIPKGVEKIGPAAFRDCTSLTSLNIPEDTIVYSGAFTGSGIKTINGIDAETWIALHCVDDYEDD